MRFDPRTLLEATGDMLRSAVPKEYGFIVMVFEEDQQTGPAKCFFTARCTQANVVPAMHRFIETCDETDSPFWQTGGPDEEMR